MVESNKVSIEFTINEAKILRRAIQGYTPPKDDEMISAMLYVRITRKIQESLGKNESL